MLLWIMLLFLSHWHMFRCFSSVVYFVFSHPCSSIFAPTHYRLNWSRAWERDCRAEISLWWWSWRKGKNLTIVQRNAKCETLRKKERTRNVKAAHRAIHRLLEVPHWGRWGKMRYPQRRKNRANKTMPLSQTIPHISGIRHLDGNAQFHLKPREPDSHLQVSSFNISMNKTRPVFKTQSVSKILVCPCNQTICPPLYLT